MTPNGVLFTSAFPLADPAYIGFDDEPLRGEMIVHRDMVDDAQETFEALYEARYPSAGCSYWATTTETTIAPLRPTTLTVTAIARSRHRSLVRPCLGPRHRHQPRPEPDLVGDQILPAAGQDFTGIGRGPNAPQHPGIISENDIAFRAFSDRGRMRGGEWSEPKLDRPQR